MSPVYDTLDPAKPKPAAVLTADLTKTMQILVRSGDDRRRHPDRRRSSRGLYEHRARREGIIDDRRQAAAARAPRTFCGTMPGCCLDCSDRSGPVTKQGVKLFPEMLQAAR